MATTNLNEISIGDILVGSGNGTPDHSRPKGSMYTDEDTGTLYQNLDGSTNWGAMLAAAYGDGEYNENTTATTISVTNTWVAAGNNFTAGITNGMTVSTDTLVADVAGTYHITMTATLDWVAGTDNFEAGISINGASPVAGTYNGAYVDTTHTTASVTVNYIVTLSAADTIEIAVRNIDGTNNIIVQHAQLAARRIG